MKIKFFCILLSIAVIGCMWYYSPARKEKLIPMVETISPLREDVKDSVVTHGRVEENMKQNVRLTETATIDKLYVTVGDFVEAGSVIMDICEKDMEISDIAGVSNYLPDVQDISNIEEFYVPASFNEALDLTPEVTAPISGVVTNINVKEGDVALGKLPILTISDFNNLCIRASIPELYIGEIKVGQKAKITSQAVPNKSFTATVTEISPVATQKLSLTGTGETTVDVMLSVENKNMQLKPGYSVNAKIYTKTHAKTLTLPYTCIFQENNKEFVYVVKNDKLVKTEIKTSLELNDKVEVVRGIKEDDMVVNNPNDEFTDSMTVKVVK